MDNSNYLSLFSKNDFVIFDSHLRFILNNNPNLFKTYNIYYYYNSDIKVKINDISDIEKYFSNDFKFKRRYINKIKYIKDFNKYYILFKLKNMDLTYLNNYILNANNIINDINTSKYYNPYVYSYIKLINMYKYGVKNIYEDLLNFNIIKKRLYISLTIGNIENIHKYIRSIKYYNIHNEICKEIKHYIKY